MLGFRIQNVEQISESAQLNILHIAQGRIQYLYYSRTLLNFPEGIHPQVVGTEVITCVRLFILFFDLATLFWRMGVNY